MQIPAGNIATTGLHPHDLSSATVHTSTEFTCNICKHFDSLLKKNLWFQSIVFTFLPHSFYDHNCYNHIICRKKTSYKTKKQYDLDRHRAIRYMYIAIRWVSSVAETEMYTTHSWPYMLCLNTINNIVMYFTAKQIRQSGYPGCRRQWVFWWLHKATWEACNCPVHLTTTTHWHPSEHLWWSQHKCTSKLELPCS